MGEVRTKKGRPGGAAFSMHVTLPATQHHAITRDAHLIAIGLADGLFAEKVAVKQGWMCCWGPDNQVHLTTGVTGPDHRYVIAMASMQPVDEVAARATMTETLKTMFPGGRI